MIAAGIEGYIFYIAAAAYGVFAMWMEHRKKKEAAELEKRIKENEKRPAPAPDAPAARPAGGETTEQERLRKFLEALGVPSSQPSSQPPQQPRPVAPQPAAPEKPVFRPVSPKPTPVPAWPVSPRPVPQPARPPTVPQPPARPAPRSLEEMQSREHLDPGQGEPIGQFTEPSTRLDSMARELDSDMDRRDRAASRELMSAGGSEFKAARETSALRELLRSPESLRTAFLVKEILGPPTALAEPRH